MNKNQLSLTVKSQSGGTWPDAEFNMHHKVRHVLDAALKTLHLDTSRTYEVLLDGRSLPLDASLAEAGVGDGALLLIRTIGHTIDG